MDLDELERLLREATAGPWIGAGPSFGDPLPRYTTSMVTEWEDDDGFRTICEFGYAHHDDENEANAQLIAALRNCAEELIRDARRYRWLIQQSWFQAESEFRLSMSPEHIFPDDVSQYIDAAIAKEGKG